MTIRKGTYTFEKWCIDNNKSKYLDLWDYELNRKNPSEVSHKTKDKYYFKCECGKHVSFQKGINNLINSKDLICVECNSFYEWCISNGKNDILDCWDYEINLDDPKFVSFGSGKKYWFKINEDCSYLFNISYITSRTKALSPIEKYYNSLGFYLIKNYGEDAILKYWSNKNVDSPYNYDVGSGKKAWFICQEKEYHDDCNTTIYSFTGKSSIRCPMCSHKIVHPKDSFAQFNIDRYGDDWVEKCWCYDNKLDPFKIPPYKNNPKVHLKCMNISYHDFWTTPATYSTHSSCPYCGNNIGGGGAHHRTHKNDSLGARYPKILNLWSDKNKKTAYDYSPKKP